MRIHGSDLGARVRREGSGAARSVRSGSARANGHGTYLVAWISLAALLLGCATPAQTSQSSAPAAALQATSAFKRVGMGVLLVPVNVREGRNGGNLMPMAIGSLTILDDATVRHPLLAESVPSIENGGWKVFPDGRMEITWRLHEGTRWHDGQPLTTDDLLFTATVGRDREMAAFHSPVFDLIESVEALDARTVQVRWRQPSIEAIILFGLGRSIFTAPLPRHLLERPYLENKLSLEDLPYWNTDFVGSGPYKLREWVNGSGFTLDAFPDFVLGRPRVDQIEVKFFSDSNTLVANILAGQIDFTTSTSVTIDQGAAMRDQWRDGKLATNNAGWLMMYPQLHHPNPPAFGDPQFRRALVHAMDRQIIADTVTLGFSPVAHSIISPDVPEYPLIESSIVKYEYDPRRAVQLMEGLGYTRGADGMFRDAAGERPSIEVITPNLGSGPIAATAILDYWQRIGVGGTLQVLPPQGIECRPCYTGYDIVNQTHGIEGITNLLYSAGAPLPERNYRAPQSNINRGAYVNREYDALMDRYKATIPLSERIQLIAQLVHWQTDLQLVTGLVFATNAIMISNRLQHALPGTTWNVHQWDVAG